MKTKIAAVVLVVLAAVASACIETESPRCSYNRGCWLARGGCCATIVP